LVCVAGARAKLAAAPENDGKEARKGALQLSCRGARVAGGQNYEVRCEAKKKRTTAGAVTKAVKKVGNSRKCVERALKKKR
jgi:Protein of unknown function (DUF3606)